MQSFSREYLERLVIPPRLIAIIRRIGEHQGRQELYRRQAPEMLESLRQVAVIQSTESSNRLEGITADYGRIRELIEQKASPANRPESEIAGYRDVLNTIHTNYPHIPFQDNVVLQLHRDLMKYTGGEGGRWKSAPNEITEHLANGSKRIRFVPVEPAFVQDYMRRLHERYTELEKEQIFDPLVIVPLYLLDFLCIHPFLDGNGRMARILSVLLLYRYNYEVGRYISLERIIEQTRESYYDTLYQSSLGWHAGGHNVLSWMEYFLATVLAAFREFEGRLGKISSGRGSKTDMVLNAINGFIGDFTLADLEKACPTVGKDMIRTLMKRLKSEGRLEALSKGRYARWRKIQ